MAKQLPLYIIEFVEKDDDEAGAMYFLRAKSIKDAKATALKKYKASGGTGVLDSCIRA